MPIYEYECNRCSFKFEVKRGFNETGGNICPVCGAEGRQVFQAPPLLFKGSGFYITDSRKGSGKSEEGSQPAKPEPVKPPAKSGPGEPAKKP